MRKIYSILVILFGLSIVSCNNNNPDAKPGHDNTSENQDSMPSNNGELKDFLGKEVATLNGISIYELDRSPEFPNASLKLNTLPKTLLPGNTTFSFDIQNYELKQQTNAEVKDHCANSSDGQHIHYILNGEPYKTYYTDTFTENLPDGQHTLLAFLSRSYHESLKNPEAFVIQNLLVGKTNRMAPQNLEEPMLFYSRPKGKYEGKDIEHLLLDFYVLNAKLAADGYKVLATVNGNEFTLTEWKAYIIKGLTPGKVTISLQLVDKDNNPVEGKYTSVTREVELVR